MTTPEEIDTRGMRCPLPVLRAQKRLRAMPPGAVLRVLADDPVALIDMPHFCAEAGHDYLGASDEGGSQVHLIRKQNGRP
ncbi:sulfurtransferase TusA family protein [Pseudoroseicyclus aestuarii]|uniref:tRNA 2-thiouridine synthesizing protein A n=1 Tax=Pseudoroseicyclus aestuarii TaxID=1795041 RepID=A0A318T0C5_9RHOB|nr:sulfurtransferase TusA family protein [Pseudoroseicyclus aestuarii]PYE86069.1 tRNA 2-thiouridine synthesizing protein A [Pseudoroseicyclus aestuarii]